MTPSNNWHERQNKIKDMYLHESIDFMEVMLEFPDDIVQKFEGYPCCEHTLVLMMDYMAEQEAMRKY